MSASTSTEAKGLFAHFRAPLAIDAVWLAAAPFVLVAGALLTPIRPFDYFWSLVQGRAVLQLGHVPAQNLFLHTLPREAPFLDQPWLAQVTMYLAYQLGGHTANLLLLAGLLGLAMAITLDTGLRTGASPRAVGILALAVAPLLALGAGVRTQMFAYPCFALVLRGAALRWPDRRKVALTIAAAATALWANLHGSFVLAPLLFVLGWLGTGLAPASGETDRRACIRRALVEVGVITLATMVNPHGPRAWGYAVELGAAMRAEGHPVVAEWAAPSLGEVTGVLFYGLAGFLLAGAVWRRRHLVLASFLPHVAMALLAGFSLRFLPWWALSAVVVGSRAGGGANAAADARRGSVWINWALLATFAGAVGLCLPGAPLFERATVRGRLPYAEGRALAAETPLRLAESLASGYPGRLFHSQAVGGLVEWTLAKREPRQVAFVDQRFELTPPELWRDYFLVCAARAGWEALLDRYGIGTVLVDDVEASPLIELLAVHPAWRLRSQDLSYRLFERVGATTK